MEDISRTDDSAVLKSVVPTDDTFLLCDRHRNEKFILGVHFLRKNYEIWKKAIIYFYEGI